MHGDELHTHVDHSIEDEYEQTWHDIVLEGNKSTQLTIFHIVEGIKAPPGGSPCNMRFGNVIRQLECMGDETTKLAGWQPSTRIQTNKKKKSSNQRLAP